MTDTVKPDNTTGDIKTIGNLLADRNITSDNATDLDTAMPDWLLPDKAYDILKWVALIVLPALATLVQTLGPVWGWPYVDAIVTTLNALGTLCGMLIGASAIKAKYDLSA